MALPAPCYVVMAVAGLLIGPVFGILIQKEVLEMFLVHSYHFQLPLLFEVLSLDVGTDFARYGITMLRHCR